MTIEADIKKWRKVKDEIESLKAQEEELKTKIIDSMKEKDINEINVDGEKYVYVRAERYNWNIRALRDYLGEEADTYITREVKFKASTPKLKKLPDWAQLKKFATSTVTEYLKKK